MASGRKPKAPGTRAGHGSRESTKALLPIDANVGADIPRMPAHPSGKKWHPLAIKLWNDVWTSPMASEYVEADMNGMVLLVTLMHEFTEDPKASLSAEIRQLGYNYGLSPMDRRRLQWTIVKTGEAVQDAENRRARRANPIRGNEDPRDVLR